MRDLPLIRSIYLDVDGELEAQRSRARTIGDNDAVSRIEEKQRINDQAYFVLCWGQLETEIDNRCRAAIRSRLASGNWATRRAWDLYNPDDRRLSGLRFEDRTALVLDRSGGPRSHYATVMGYYALRNQIAHGDLQAHRIDVEKVVNELFHIQAALQT